MGSVDENKEGTAPDATEDIDGDETGSLMKGGIRRAVSKRSSDETGNEGVGLLQLQHMHGHQDAKFATGQKARA